MRPPFRELVGIVIRLLDASALGDVCSALETGEFGTKSTASVLGKISSGRQNVQSALIDLRSIWNREYSKFKAFEFSYMLRTACEAIEVARSYSPMTQVVWTGPEVQGSFPRSTRQVVQDIINGAKQELLVVGYWIAAKEDAEGIIKDIVDLVAKAVKRDVSVKMVLDKDKKPYGKDNREILLELWQRDVKLPELYTWDVQTEDNHLKMHAKVLVADRRDALITSANLTMYALDRNMEMGVRVIGRLGAKIAEHFDLLVSTGILGPFES